MRCGLYGKLPAKRDFIAHGSPREFLRVWEPWVQGGLSSSRVALGERWQAAFLRAPIWRFWLGADICGSTVLGAFMPSVDGVGRYFPLTIFARAEEGEDLAPPELDPHDAWFEPAEGVLLSALEEHAAYESTVDALTRLPTALGAQALASAAPDGLTRMRDGAVVGRFAAGSLATSLAAVRAYDHGNVYASMTYMWTVGGEGFEPLVMASRRLPDPTLFTGMLTGRFDES